MKLAIPTFCCIIPQCLHPCDFPSCCWSRGIWCVFCWRCGFRFLRGNLLPRILLFLLSMLLRLYRFLSCGLVSFLSRDYTKNAAFCLDPDRFLLRSCTRSWGMSLLRHCSFFLSHLLVSRQKQFL